MCGLLLSLGHLLPDVVLSLASYINPLHVSVLCANSKKIAAQLLVLGGCACYAGHQLTTAAGSITLAADVPNGSHIH